MEGRRPPFNSEDFDPSEWYSDEYQNLPHWANEKIRAYYRNRDEEQEEQPQQYESKYPSRPDLVAKRKELGSEISELSGLILEKEVQSSQPQKWIYRGTKDEWPEKRIFYYISYKPENPTKIDYIEGNVKRVTITTTILGEPESKDNNRRFTIMVETDKKLTPFNLNAVYQYKLIVDTPNSNPRGIEDTTLEGKREKLSYESALGIVKTLKGILDNEPNPPIAKLE